MGTDRAKHDTERRRSRFGKVSATVLIAISCVAPGPGQSEDLPRDAFASTQLVLTSLEQNMVRVMGGKFMMGNPSAKDPSTERPVHTVVVKSFLMSAYEVTFDQYDVYAKSTGRQMPADEGWGRGNLPVINVSWDDAQEFVAWLNERTSRHYRLPSEAEWEYAARAATTTNYPWGPAFDSTLVNGKGISGADRWAHTSPVGSFPPNAWGLYDVIGNVAEWTADCWNANYVGAPADGSAWQKGACSQRVFRGGSWAVDSVYQTTYFRMMVARSFRNHALGFRLAEDM